MKLDVPTGTTFYWNPYSPKYYTIVQSPTAQLINNSSSSDDEGSSFSFSNSDDHSSITAASVVKRSPTDDTYNLGWSTISSVRQEKTTDNAICAMIQRFPMKTLTAMVSVIENSPNLFLELCEKERGNVVSHVIAALNGAKCEELISMTVEHIDRLAKHQSGCIALTRIYDGASADQQMAMALALLQNFDELLCHPFGNFVLTRIAQGTVDPTIAEFMCAQFESHQTLIRAINDKFGSHVYEAFVKSCEPEQLFRVCSVLFSDMDTVIAVSTSKIANYPLQNTLRQMMGADGQHELSRWALATIPPLVAETKFATNINRALGFGRTADRNQQQQQNNGPRKVVRAQ